MPKYDHLKKSIEKIRASQIDPSIAKHIKQNPKPDIKETDFNIHHKAREYLMLMQAILSSYPQVEYRDLWQIQVFIHNLITESEREYLAE